MGSEPTLITDLKGVGSTTLSRLKDAGLTTIESIAVTPKRELMEKTGMSEETAEALLQKVRELLGLEFMNPYLMIPKKIQALVRVYFELLAQRKLSAAGRALNDVRQRVHSTQWLRGYVNALEGMLAASESKNNRYVLINKIDPIKASQLSREFLQHSRDELQADFDKGFFSAWTDYLRFIGSTSIGEKQITDMSGDEL